MALKENRLIAILAQIFGMSLIVPILLYFVCNDRFIKEQAKRSIAFHGLLWIVIIAYGILYAILNTVTFGLFGFLSVLIVGLSKIIYVVFIIYISIQIWNGNNANYPFVSNILNKIKF